LITTLSPQRSDSHGKIKKIGEVNVKLEDINLPSHSVPNSLNLLKIINFLSIMFKVLLALDLVDKKLKLLEILVLLLILKVKDKLFTKLIKLSLNSPKNILLIIKNMLENYKSTM